MSIYKLRVRRDSATNWASINPILSLGEVGFETDTTKLKVGNGEDYWLTPNLRNCSINSFRNSPLIE